MGKTSFNPLCSVNMYFFCCSSVIKRPNDSMRVILTTFVGVFLGFLIGISFPLLSLTKVDIDECS